MRTVLSRRSRAEDEVLVFLIELFTDVLVGSVFEALGWWMSGTDEGSTERRGRYVLCVLFGAGAALAAGFALARLVGAG